MSNKFSKTEAKQYASVLFNTLLGTLNITRKVRVLTIRIPFCSVNGFTVSFGRKNRLSDLVIINISPYVANSGLTPQMARFFLHSVIAHELKHIQILQDWYTGVSTDFRILFSQWALDHVRTRFQPDCIIRHYLSYKGASVLRRKRYDVSSMELCCFQYGFQEAMRALGSTLDDEDKTLAQTILDSIVFVNQYLEIDYFSSKQAYNRFTHTLYYLQKYVRKYPQQIKNYPQLACVFSPNGLLKTPNLLFSERTEDNSSFIDDVLIRMFITMSFDWQSIFAHNTDLYHHMGILANQYCNDSISYLKHTQLGEVFLHQDILQDNAAMLIKNVNTLNQLMTLYRIPRTAGSVLPLYYSDDFTKADPSHDHAKMQSMQ